MVEASENSNRLDWGDDIEQMREQTDKKGGGLTMLKYRDDCKYDKLGYTCRVILNAKLDLGRQKIYVLLEHHDVNDKRDKYIYENLDLMMKELDNQMPVIVIGDFNGDIGFLEDQDKNYNGVKLLEFVERWNRIMNCDAKCRGTYTRIERQNKCY